jgi:hypothetical protein
VSQLAAYDKDNDLLYDSVRMESVYDKQRRSAMRLRTWTQRQLDRRFIFMPYSTFRLFWDALISVLLIVEMIYVGDSFVETS